MAGRRRRSPGGGTAGERSIRYIKEESILNPKPFNMPDEDWPCYVLTDATVYRSDGRTIANPLHVHLEGPMIIRGKLVVDNEDEVAISNRKFRVGSPADFEHSLTVLVQLSTLPPEPRISR